MAARRWMSEVEGALPALPSDGSSYGVVHSIKVEWTDNPDGDLDVVLSVSATREYTDAWLARELRELADQLE